MHKVFGAIFLPIVSTKVMLLLKQTFERSHTDFVLKNQDLLSTTHLSLSQTLQATKKGILCMDSSGIRRTYKKFEENCPRSIKMDFD